MKLKRLAITIFLILSMASSAYAMNNGILFFTTPNGNTTNHLSLWVSDGTPEGTLEVASKGTFDNSRAYNVKGTLIYRNGDSLWRSDGTQKGTFKIYDFNHNSGSFYELVFPEMSPKNYLYFYGNDHKIWRTDGTIEGTSTDFFGEIPGSPIKYHTEFHKAERTTYFSSYENSSPILWKTDGTAPGTKKIKKLPWTIAAYNRVIGTTDDNIFIWAGNPKIPGTCLLYISDGTKKGTRRVRDRHAQLFFTKPTYDLPEFSFNGKFVFRARTFKKTAPGEVNEYLGEELWCSDGTRRGTVFLGDIDPGGNYNPKADNLISMGDHFFFHAHHSTNGRELWISDGTSDGTRMVKDIYSGIGSSVSEYYWNSATTQNIIYFWAEDGKHGRELWKSDGTENGTVMVKDINAKNNTPSTTKEISPAKAVAPLITKSDLRGYSDDDDDACEVGLIREDFDNFSDSEDQENTTSNNDVEERHPLSPYSLRFMSMDKKGDLYFFTDNGINGIELWKSDGTEKGTFLVKDINPGSAGLTVISAELIDEIIYFNFYAPELGNVLWKSDGTEKGTIQIKKISDKDADYSKEKQWYYLKKS